jgi:hypothetical protein
MMPVHAAESTEELGGLDYYELKDLVKDKTVDCRKEKDKSTCVNYFSPKGVLIQVRDNGDRKDGRWFLDDSDRLCILWNGKIKPLCFTVTENDDGGYDMIKKGKHKSTMLKVTDGNRDNLE